MSVLSVPTVNVSWPAGVLQICPPLMHTFSGLIADNHHWCPCDCQFICGHAQRNAREIDCKQACEQWLFAVGRSHAVCCVGSTSAWEIE